MSTATTTTATATRWRGYYRPRRGPAWSAATEEHDDYGACWSALLDATAGKPQGEMIVSVSDPNCAAPRRASR